MPITVCISEEASKILLENKLYPLRDELTQFFVSHGIFEYDANTVATIVDKLLIKSEFFETRYMVRDILYECLETHPDITQQITRNVLQSDLERCLILMAVLRKYCPQQTRGDSLMLRKAPEQTIKIRTRIFEIQHARENITRLLQLPEFFEGDVLVCDNFQELMKCLDETSILANASNNQEIEFAIHIALFKYAIYRGEKPNWDNILTPTIGPGFRESCLQCCKDQSNSLPPKILRSIVETVRHEKDSARHALRTSQGGNAPQLVCGSYKAWRCDIDTEFHLHYWKSDDKTIKLAKVVYHNNFSI